MADKVKRLFLARPLGFCGGVRRALELFEKTADQNPGKPIYVLHELVHNRTVTEDMRRRNARFVERLEEIPDGAVTVFGAHGIGASLEQEARRRGLRYCDAVCPLVAQLQNVAASADADLPLILFGDGKHPEVRSVLDRAAAWSIFVIASVDEVETLPPMQSALLLCQTTRNFQEVKAVAALLRERIPGLQDLSKVCDAVSRRQRAMEQLSPKCDLVLVVGSPHSSNGRRLLAIAQQHCSRALLVENADALDENMLEDVFNVGMGAATSTPDYAINSVIDKLQKNGFQIASEDF